MTDRQRYAGAVKALKLIEALDDTRTLGTARLVARVALDVLHPRRRKGPRKPVPVKAS